MLVSWLIYECSDTIEQSVIPGYSNDEKLADVHICNYYRCKVAQSLPRFPQGSTVCESIQQLRETVMIADNRLVMDWYHTMESFVLTKQLLWLTVG